MNWTEALDASLAELSKPELPSDIKLPILPNVVTEFSQKANDPNITAKKLGAVVEVDAALTMELLKHVNSAAIGLKRKAVTPQQAISLLGISQSKLFLLGRGLRLSLSGLNNRSKEILDTQLFWNTNLERALFAREIAKLLRADTDVSFAAAMMQDIMLPVLIDANLDTYKAHLESVGESAISLSEFEKEKLGFDHSIAAAFLMKDWGFPDALICCSLHHHAGAELLKHPQFGKTAAAAVAVSSLLPDALCQSPNGFDQLVQLEESLSGFSLERFATMIDDYFEELSDGKSKRTPLTQRVEEALATAAS